MSKTPITSSPERIGITISDLEAELHAIWPSNLFTSSKMIDYLLAHDVPQTPTPLKSLVQAGGPWNWPSAKCSPFSVFLSQ